MEKVILPEYLGDVDAQLLLQNLTNINPHFNTIDDIREFIRVPFEVSAEYEFTFDDPKDKPSSKRFVRLVLDPSQGEYNLDELLAKAKKR